MIHQRHAHISEIDGKPITTHFYSLSPEERTRFQEMLEGYKKEKVEAFVRSIEPYLQYTHRILDDLNFRKRADHRDRLDKIKKRLEKTHGDILRIQSGRLRIFPCRQCDYVDYNGKETKNPQEKIFREIIFCSTIIGEHLPEIIKNLSLVLKTLEVKRGDHKADEFLLAAQIAQRFKRYIGTPRPYAGPFPKICKYCFDIVGIRMGEKKNIRRAMKGALGGLTSPQPAKAV